MRVNHIMTTGVQVGAPDTTIAAAAAQMLEHDIGCLPICDGERLTGIVTDRDLVVRGLAAGNGQTATCADVMTPDVAWCYDDDDVQVAARIMHERQVRRLPVVDRDKRLVGILSLGDLAVRGADERLSGETLEAISAPGMSG